MRRGRNIKRNKQNKKNKTRREKKTRRNTIRSRKQIKHNGIETQTSKNDVKNPNIESREDIKASHELRQAATSSNK